jgi:hemoglobin/transferrin/lactoferrin receptor protein
MQRSKISFAVCTALLCSAAQAKTDTSFLNLDNVTVITSSIDSESDTTQSNDVILQDEIRSINAQNVTDVFKYSPNVEVTGGPSGDVKSISIRGLGQDHANVTIDGARQTYSHSKRGSWAINPSLLKSATVTNGTSSGAAAGAVKLEFISAYDLLKPDASFGTLVNSGFRSNNNQQDLSATIYGLNNGFDWLLSASDSSHDPYSIGGGYQRDGKDSYYKTGGENQSYLFKSGYDLSPSEYIGLSVYMDNSEWDQVRQDYGYNTRDYTSAVLNYSNQGSNSDFLDFNANVYINQVDTYTREYTDETKATTSDTQKIADDSYGFMLTNNSLLNGPFEETLLHYGLSGHFTTHDGEVGTLDNGSWVDESAQSEPSAKSHQLASWINAQMLLGNGFTLIPSLRYDEFYVESSNAEFEGEALLRDGRTENQLSTGLRLNQEINEKLNLFVAYDEALTAPGLSELFTSGRGFKPNPNLKSERSQNKEIGFTFNCGSVITHDDSLLAKINVFQNDIKDYIGTDYTDPAYKDGVKVNRDEIRLRGGEILTQYRYESWDVSASYGMTIGEDLTTGEYLSDMPSDKFVVSIENQLSDEWRLSGKATHALKRHRVPTTQIDRNGDTEIIPEDERQSVSAWTTVDLYAEYIPAQLQDMTLSMSVTNLFDEAYALQNNSRADTKAEYYEEGRSLNIDLSYNF